MTSLYEANKQTVYFVANCLLMDARQAEDVTVTVFRQIWPQLKSANIATEERFSNHLVCSVIHLCMETLCSRDPQALKLPPHKNFTIPADTPAEDAGQGALAYVLRNLPPVQKYIFVMHAAGGLEVMQIARLLKCDSKTVRAAMDAEADNIRRLQHLSRQGYTGSYTHILEEVEQARTATAVPEAAEARIKEELHRIAAPAEARARRRKYFLRALAGLLAAGLLVGVSALLLTSDPAGETAASPTDSAERTAVPTGLPEETTVAQATEETAESIQELLTCYADIVIADYGTVTVALDAEAAPATVANFVELAESGFYDGLTFHRIIEGFMMQGGCPEGTGYGGSDREIPGEFSENGFDNPLSHTRGAISMARSNDPNSASSQFFIVHQDSADSLDGKYAAFGYVTEGMDVVDAICQAAVPIDGNGSIQADAQPVITSITIRTEAAP